jgi:hypothetical protein
MHQAFPVEVSFNGSEFYRADGSDDEGAKNGGFDELFFSYQCFNS